MDDVRWFLDASEAFFEALAAVGWGALGLAVACHVVRLGLRGRAWQNILRASYPGAHIRYWPTIGAYVAGVGVNAVVPARGGDVVKLYLAKHRAVKEASYPTLASTLVVETLLDFVFASLLFVWALQAGLLPGTPDLSSIRAFDWSFVFEHPEVSAFVGSLLLGGAILLVAWASEHVTAFKEKVARGFTVLGDWRVYLRRVASWQAASWVARVGSTFFFLRAFHVDATVETTMAVLVVQGLSTMLPFTPGGAGTQQAVLVFSLGSAASRSTILAFSFGQQLVITTVNVALGFGAILAMLGTLRWRRHVAGIKDDVYAPALEGELIEEPAAAPSGSALPG